MPEDDAEAVRWYRMAAEQGDAGAQYMLGVMYGKGEGVPQDPVFAHMWFNLAGAAGFDGASDVRDTIEKIMTRAELSEARKRAREWFEARP